MHGIHVSWVPTSLTFIVDHTSSYYGSKCLLMHERVNEHHCNFCTKLSLAIRGEAEGRNFTKPQGDHFWPRTPKKQRYCVCVCVCFQFEKGFFYFVKFAYMKITLREAHTHLLLVLMGVYLTRHASYCMLAITNLKQRWKARREIMLFHPKALQNTSSLLYYHVWGVMCATRRGDGHKHFPHKNDDFDISTSRGIEMWTMSKVISWHASTMPSCAL